MDIYNVNDKNYPQKLADIANPSQKALCFGISFRHTIKRRLLLLEQENVHIMAERWPMSMQNFLLHMVYR